MLLNKTRAIADPGAEVKKRKLVRALRWRAPGWPLVPGVFRANSEPNQLGKPDSCAS